VEDYVEKGQLITANQHRAMFEAANHRLWEITSGFTQWKLNACWPSVQWQIYDWYLCPMVSYYYIKRACEPLHVQLSPLDSMVTVVNNRLEAQRNLSVSARVYDLDMQLSWEKHAEMDIGANRYQDALALPEIPGLTPVYFVKLELRDREGNLVSDNFYWLSSQTPAVPDEVYWEAQGQEIKHAADFSALRALPPVRLDVSHDVEFHGQEAIAQVLVANPTDRLAFLVHLAVTQGPGGERVVPIFWQDNYFCLLPHESKRVEARFAVKDLRGAIPALKVGGWNIEGK
jgi:exo-1,4-beta-D-glucosaminidase